MDKYLTGAIYILFLLSLIANSGCIGEKAEAVQSYKYVCSDGSIVSDSQECRIEEPACSCNVPPVVCVCNQTAAGCASNQTGPVQTGLTRDTQIGSDPDDDIVDTDTMTDTVNASLLVETVESADPCVELGCPKGSLFVGNNDTKKFHYCTCAQAQKISPRNRVCFNSAKSAEDLGFIPCGFCKPSDVKSET